MPASWFNACPLVHKSFQPSEERGFALGSSIQDRVPETWDDAIIPFKWCLMMCAMGLSGHQDALFLQKSQEPLNTIKESFENAGGWLRHPSNLWDRMQTQPDIKLLYIKHLSQTLPYARPPQSHPLPICRRLSTLRKFFSIVKCRHENPEAKEGDESPSTRITCMPLTTAGRSEVFMWAQAWNCWLMQVKKVADERPMSSHAGVHRVANRHSKVKGAAGLKTCSNQKFECNCPSSLWQEISALREKQKLLFLPRKQDLPFPLEVLPSAKQIFHSTGILDPCPRMQTSHSLLVKRCLRIIWCCCNDVSV